MLSFPLLGRSWAVLSLLSLFALPHAARAGSYSVAYTVTPGSGNIATYTPSTYDCKGTGSRSAFTSYGSGPESFSAIANDKITATFTWSPTNGDSVADPPPSCAIVQQMSSASWSGGMQGDAPVPTGDCDTGLPASSSTYTTGTLSKSGSATYYFVKSQPGSSFTADCTPTASSSGSSGSPGSGSYGNVSVSYSASAASVIVTPGGVTKSQLLTGQQVSATLTIPRPFSPNNITYTVDNATYQWSAPGDTFYTYNGQAPSHQLILLSDDPSYTTSPTFTFYDKSAESVTVNCSATVVCPDGKTHLPVTVQSQPITVLKPTAVWTANSTDPYGPQFNQTMMGFAVQWNASITVPSPFSGGSGCFAQIVTPTTQFQRYPINNRPSICYLKEPHTNADGTTSYVLPTTGLDTQFPYPLDLTTYYPNGYIWDVSGVGQSGDVPNVHFNIPASDNGGNNWYTAFDSDTFTTWLMYMPTSGGTGPPVWVPLQRVDWSWTGNVVKSSTTGMWNSANSGAAVTGSSSNPGVSTGTPPQWNTVNTGATTLQP